MASSLARAQSPISAGCGDSGPAVQGQTSEANWLTPEALGMSRDKIAFGGPMLRIFNGRGAVSIRDKSVTGLEGLQFPPIDVSDYRFSLAFREAKTSTLIQDIVPEVFERLLQTGEGPNPLGLNFVPGTPYVLIWQRAYWQPNCYTRTGTFDKELNGHLISFAIATQASVAAENDEVYLEVDITNRGSGPLALTVIPNQHASNLALRYPNVETKSGGPLSRPDAFTLEGGQTRITVVSDLEERAKEGWKWEIPGGSARSARFALVLQQKPVVAPEVLAPGIAQKINQAGCATRDRLKWASENLPNVSSDDALFNDFYRRCILSVLESRWERDNFIVKPFYAVGTWLFTITWDTSYASEMLSMLDPEGLRQAFLADLRPGLLKSTYVPWNGKTDNYWYAQSPFAAMRILQDYLRQTGDKDFLDHREQGVTVFEWMKQVGREVEKRFARPDGLLDFGAGSEKMIEIRTDGYQHAVAATNGLAVAYFRQMAAWCRERADPEAAQFDRWAGQLQESMNRDLWSDADGWFLNVYPDGTRRLVRSYHQFELLDSGILSMSQQRELISHLKEGEFLGPYGMYSISKADLAHWDREDADFGGGGQYAGEPLRVSESLYRLGQSELAWDILARCTRWAEHFPYIPQSIFTDFPGNTQVEMPLEISAGGGVQAILFGVFGLRPHADGSLEVLPSYHHELGKAKMTGYRFRGHTYDVVMGPWDYQVYRDNKLAAKNTYGQAAEFSKP
jgi:hypothetical protein